jgi:hypothetical protein
LSHGRGGGVDRIPQLMGLPPVLLLMAVPMPASHPLGLAWDWETVNIPYPALALVITAGAAGGRFLTLMVPGGLEEMFFELAGLPPDSITDPAARAAISARHDSIPA